MSSKGNAFVHCVHEYKNPANVKNGQRSQEITFDFIQAEAGIYRLAQTIPGHRYQIEAWGKHVRSRSPVELSLGVDLADGGDWQAASVMWYPWNETEEDVWVHTQLTARASGESLTIFLKGYHPFATQGGATLFDDVRVTDLGPSSLVRLARPILPRQRLQPSDYHQATAIDSPWEDGYNVIRR